MNFKEIFQDNQVAVTLITGKVIGGVILEDNEKFLKFSTTDKKIIYINRSSIMIIQEHH